MVFAVIDNNFFIDGYTRVRKILYGNWRLLITFLIGNGLDR